MCYDKKIKGINLYFGRVVGHSDALKKIIYNNVLSLNYHL